MNPGDKMSSKELADALRKLMVEKDLTYKEVAGAAARSIATIQRARNGEKLSARTFMRIKAVVISF